MIGTRHPDTASRLLRESNAEALRPETAAASRPARLRTSPPAGEAVLARLAIGPTEALAARFAVQDAIVAVQPAGPLAGGSRVVAACATTRTGAAAGVAVADKIGKRTADRVTGGKARRAARVAYAERRLATQPARAAGHVAQRAASSLCRPAQRLAGIDLKLILAALTGNLAGDRDHQGKKHGYNDPRFPSDEDSPSWFPTFQFSRKNHDRILPKENVIATGRRKASTMPAALQFTRVD
jgi:hypothetical protein